MTAPEAAPTGAAAGTAAAPGPPPGFWRRLACFLYEGVLLFGIVMFAGLLYGLVTNQRHALAGVRGLQVFLFAVLGVYFVHFWSRHGQTLAMRTWHIRLVDASGRPPGAWRATARYVASWLWFVPALALLHFEGVKGGFAIGVTLIAGVLGYAALARLHPERQYLHDALCGTRLVTWRAPQRR
jgi:uncharacterized RDD family membrane protein YckC